MYDLYARSASFEEIGENRYVRMQRVRRHFAAFQIHKHTVYTVSLSETAFATVSSSFAKYSLCTRNVLGQDRYSH